MTLFYFDGRSPVLWARALPVGQHLDSSGRGLMRRFAQQGHHDDSIDKLRQHYSVGGTRHPEVSRVIWRKQVRRVLGRRVAESQGARTQ